MVGTELNETSLQRAAQNGHSVIKGDSLDSLPDAEFDLIAAADVLEYVPESTLPDFSRDMSRLMKKGAVLVSRFPKGDSPPPDSYNMVIPRM